MTPGPTSPPRLTVAIPLYRSAPFVERILDNIAALGIDDADILISDRHCDDDAANQLEARLAADSRVRVLRFGDRIGWVDHYNALLHAASGRYFVWMPHDDVTPPGYVSGLVACLDRHPEVVLAHGRVEVRDTAGQMVASEAPEVRASDVAAWSPRRALEVLLFHTRWLPQFHGVFRREPVAHAGMLIRHSTGDVEADVYWVFGAALLGEIRCEPALVYAKHLHGRNESAGWGRRTLRHVADGFVVPMAYLTSLAHARPRLVVPAMVLAGWSCLRAVACLLQDSPVPSTNARARVRSWLKRMAVGGPLR
jgi:hypothetical protein